MFFMKEKEFGSYEKIISIFYENIGKNVQVSSSQNILQFKNFSRTVV